MRSLLSVTLAVPLRGACHHDSGRDRTFAPGSPAVLVLPPGHVGSPPAGLTLENLLDRDPAPSTLWVPTPTRHGRATPRREPRGLVKSPAGRRPSSTLSGLLL